jgi:hypothetical protein
MVLITQQDEHEYISLNAARLPSAKELVGKWRSIPGLPLEEAPSDPHSRQAWAVNSWGNYYAKLQGYDHRFGTPLETWLLRAPEAGKINGRLASWFHDKPDDYRVLIHRGATTYCEGNKHYAGRAWDGFLRNRRVPIEQELTPEMRSDAQGLLRDILDLYQPRGMYAHCLFDECGHPYAHSSACPYS